MELNMGDNFFVKVASYKHVIRFKRKGELTSKYIAPFEILKTISKVAYRLISLRA